MKVMPLLLCLCLCSCRRGMVDQPHVKTMAPDVVDDNLSSARPIPLHTVARGHLEEDDAFSTGMTNGRLVVMFPAALTKTTLEQGRRRYDINCAVCHGPEGDGNGMIVQRGFRAPPSYHTERLRKAPLGYFFDVMTEGFGAMPEYASQIPARDRWTIVAYIRALQLSQEATISDVPPGQKVPSAAPVFRGDPGSGATLPELQSDSSDERGEQPK